MIFEMVFLDHIIRVIKIGLEMNFDETKQKKIHLEIDGKFGFCSFS